MVIHYLSCIKIISFYTGLQHLLYQGCKIYVARKLCHLQESGFSKLVTALAGLVFNATFNNISVILWWIIYVARRFTFVDCIFC